MKVAVVTGASRGIGRAIALELAARGFAVGVGYRTGVDAATGVARAIEAGGGRAVLLPGDVSRPEDVKALFLTVDRELGPIDVLVNNAGITRDTLLGASEPGEVEDVIAVNVHGVAHCSREAARRMIARRAGVIVNLSSVAGQRPGRGQAAYAASKGAVEALTRALAVELAPRNVRVNAVAPGVIETDMTADLRALAPDELAKRILLRRLGKPEDVAKVVAFLCGDDAAYVTGQVWNVDGGFKLE